MERTICRAFAGHWCSECCDGRDCLAFGELPDGTWGCLTHPEKTEICKIVNCLTEMKISFKDAEKAIKSSPKGEFFASNLAEMDSSTDS